MNAIALLQENLPESIEAAWIEDEADRFYLTGMKSSAGTVLVTRAAAWLLIDFRYVEEAEAKVKNCTVLEQKNLFAQAASLLRESGVKVPLRALLPAHGEPVPRDGRPPAGRGARRFRRARSPARLASRAQVRGGGRLAPRGPAHHGRNVHAHLRLYPPRPHGDRDRPGDRHDAYAPRLGR